MLPELLNQIPPDQDIGSVSADGRVTPVNATRRLRREMPMRVIPARKNARPWKPTSDRAIARNDAFNAQRYLGRTVWRRWSGYHRRSRVETKPLGIMLRITLPVSNVSARWTDLRI